jgi:hypothetical protein
MAQQLPQPPDRDCLDGQHEKTHGQKVDRSFGRLYLDEPRFALPWMFQAEAYGEKELSNEPNGAGMSPSSKSRSKTTPVARAHHHRSLRNDGAAHMPQSKRSNAQKHGVFSGSPIIAGEDPREFQELHSALIDEWQPSGPTEIDAVLSLTDLMWRKRRAQGFLRTKLMLKTFDPQSPHL